VTLAKRGASDDERLLERLKEAVSGDQSMRRLRRRYDSLREDYERLLDRLADIEQRLELSDSIDDDEPAAESTAGPTSGVPPAPPAGRLTDSLLAPLMLLREEYLAAATSIQAIVGGLESLAAGAMKGQKPAHPAPEERPGRAREESPTRPRSVQIDVKGEGFGNLLDFQEKLSTLEGVSRVSINAIDNDRATLVVELEGEEP
jgi:plasmid stabilization system protein ParE